MYSGKPKGAGSVCVVSLFCAVTQLLQLLLVTHFVCVCCHPTLPTQFALQDMDLSLPRLPSPKLGWCKAKPVLGQTEGCVCSLCCSTDWRALRCLRLDPSAGAQDTVESPWLLSLPCLVLACAWGSDPEHGGDNFPSQPPQNQEAHTSSLQGQNCCGSAGHEKLQVCRYEDTSSF